jgi:zinc and cadmium transporter
VVGGVIGYFALGSLQDYLPYLLVVASSSFVYVAVADLIPQLQRRISARETLLQLVWLALGLLLISRITSGSHFH